MCNLHRSHRDDEPIPAKSTRIDRPVAGTVGDLKRKQSETDLHTFEELMSADVKREASRLHRILSKNVAVLSLGEAVHHHVRPNLLGPILKKRFFGFRTSN